MSLSTAITQVIFRHQLNQQYKIHHLQYRQSHHRHLKIQTEMKTEISQLKTEIHGMRNILTKLVNKVDKLTDQLLYLLY